ncbi:hypothetical protein E2C01_048730 [Portunus trituberculatus]|uniref:Uncharacterized protein n=1 Tax=Portunus trituberculatus TaxID=210409 RepID=A0A5B7GBW6_PORTR|nr:hypothetical protein [Portunus trituberculatus]
MIIVIVMGLTDIKMVYDDLPDDVYHASLAVLEVKRSCAVINCDDNMAAQTNISRNLVIRDLEIYRTSKAS